jgi:ribonucleoside-diphosphate reductase alpha chain
MTNNPEVRFAKSVVDYIFRYLGLKYLSKEDQDALGLAKTMVENNDAQAKLVEPMQKPAEQRMVEHQPASRLEPDLLTFDPQSDAPACDNCGMIMVRAGSCYKCLNCGNTSGCG